MKANWEGNRNTATFLAWEIQRPAKRANFAFVYKISFWHLMELKDALWTKTSVNVGLICSVSLGFLFENIRPKNFSECYYRHFHRKKTTVWKCFKFRFVSKIEVSIWVELWIIKKEKWKEAPQARSLKLLTGVLEQWIFIAWRQST